MEKLNVDKMDYCSEIILNLFDAQHVTAKEAILILLALASTITQQGTMNR